MKISSKNIIITILCILIAFIPTYIAITYYFVKDGAPDKGYYTVIINDQDGEAIEVEDDREDKIASIVLKMNTKIYAAGSLDGEDIPDKYYDMTVVSKDFSVSYRYYFSIDKDRASLVRDKDGLFYYLNYDDAKEFLSTSCAYAFYESSALPVLSIFGGDDVLPTEAGWNYKALDGSTITLSPTVDVEGKTYAMNSTTKLSFSTAPDKCSVIVYQNGQKIAEGSDLSAIPYDRFESGPLSFEINAEWSSDDCSGYAKYKFDTVIGLAPEFFINKTTILSGEFFLVYAKNVSAPQKIQFSSSPSISFTPVFFEENDMVYALIPIDKELASPQTYEFSFSYGEQTAKISVKVEERYIRDDKPFDCSNVTARRNTESLNEYYSLLSQIGNKYETVRYFSDKFDDYELMYSSGTAKIELGYGHPRVPNNGDAAFRLDGVDYVMTSGINVTAIASGKVVYIGECELLGKFVVIDHGLGLKTWYCNIGQVNTTLGKTVGKNDIIGKPGATGYKNLNGVYLITTVMDVPVSPYPLQEEGLTLPK